jgi:hypothetical protein
MGIALTPQTALTAHSPPSAYQNSSKIVDAPQNLIGYKWLWTRSREIL